MGCEVEERVGVEMRNEILVAFRAGDIDIAVVIARHDRSVKINGGICDNAVPCVRLLHFRTRSEGEGSLRLLGGPLD